MKAALAVALLVGVASAEPVAIPNSKALFDVPKTWTRQPDDPALVGMWKRGTSILAVTRAQVPNLGAWIKASREAYVAEVERGAIGAVAGTKKLARTVADIQGVPTLDLELRRPDGTQLVIRYLLFRSYALAVTIEVAKGGSLDEARAIAKTLTAPRPNLRGRSSPYRRAPRAPINKRTL